MNRKAVTLAIAGAAMAVALAACGSVSGPSAYQTPSGTGITATAPPVTSATSAPAAPQYTVAQQSAIQDAESYLQNVGGFSRLGLAAQLEFDKFPHRLAMFAVNHVHPNWFRQAAAAARSYMQSVGGFSYGSLVQQLEFDKFTPAQAAYGAKSVGL